MAFGDRTKRAHRIAESAAPLLNGEEVRETVQVQRGRQAGANAFDVFLASEGVFLGAGKPVKSMAILATDQNIYVVTLTGARLLDAGEVLFRKPIADTDIEFAKDKITIEDTLLHVMAGWGRHVDRLKELLPEPSSD